MLRGLGSALAKDLRLLVRDRAGLLFLTLAPIVVITVAGFSLASLYGADPRGQTAYLLPVADEDGGEIGRELRARLAEVEAVRPQVVPDRAAAQALVRRQRAGTALVIPAGTSRAVAAGESATLVLLTDPVKYLEIANVRALVQEMRHGIERGARDRAAERLVAASAEARAAADELARARAILEAELASLPGRLATARDAAARQRAAAERDLVRALKDVRTRVILREIEARARLTAELKPLRRFLADLRARQRAFAAWAAEARRRAGRFADRFPPPPAPPRIPRGLLQLARLDDDALAARLLGPAELPALPRIALPPLPAFPEPPYLALPDPIALPEIALPGALAIEETSVTGAPRRLNTFDQNVPGFAVTFLLLGMLLGVSLGLLDERDWGTLVRLRAMPVPLGTVLIAKLAARFAVGVLQMLTLLAIGWLAFGVSLGPEPWALVLPTVGIVFAGTAFGLIVAGLTGSREAVLPVGSIAIVTMAAVGGCWWPIDLEPRWMQQVALAFPTTWAMAAYNDLMIRRQGAAAAVVPTVVMLAYGALYLTVGLALFRRRVRALV